MNPQQRFEKGKILKNEGNKYFKDKDYELAYEKYEEALDMIDWEVMEGVI